MAQPPKATIPDHFAELDDSRVERTRHHKPVDILAIAICATICGADSWVHIEPFGKSKLAWFQTFLELPHGIPSHDTFDDVFARLDPLQLQNCFVSWTQAIAELLPGLTGRRSDALMPVPIRMGLFRVLRHGVKTDEKSNEITAIPSACGGLEMPAS